MNKDQQTIKELQEILREIEFIEYEDPEDGLVIFCPVCGGYPKAERLSPGEQNAMTPWRARNGRGHNKDCKLARAINSL